MRHGRFDDALTKGPAWETDAMRLILSRKGFDSAAGGVASPILPDGTLISLPIPDKSSLIHYEDLAIRGHCLASLVSDLTRGGVMPTHGAHLDPDLDRSTLTRSRGWRGVFGQAGVAQRVLAREGVGPGDLFLFFGWFRQVERTGNRYRFAVNAPDVHVLWGWLQVDSVVNVADERIPAWAAYHPHAAAPNRPHNALYLARRTLDVGGLEQHAGAGTFGRFHSALRLTQPGRTRTHWMLPAWFAPHDGRPPLGFHQDPRRWTRHGDHIGLQAVSRGQEFVLDTAHYPESRQWLEELFAVGT